MSTNYYLKPNVQQEQEIDIMVEAKFPFIKKISEIHLGQYANGWVFICNHNNWEYFKDLKTFKEFTKLGIIYDEYGREILYEEFWEMALNEITCLTKQKRGDFIHSLYFSESTNFC